ncbi:MAG: hypothetical protein ACJAXS_002813, partial [Colwellia sp.]
PRLALKITSKILIYCKTGCLGSLNIVTLSHPCDRDISFFPEHKKQT